VVDLHRHARGVTITFLREFFGLVIAERSCGGEQHQPRDAAQAEERIVIAQRLRYSLGTHFVVYPSCNASDRGRGVLDDGGGTCTKRLHAWIQRGFVPFKRSLKLFDGLAWSQVD